MIIKTYDPFELVLKTPYFKCNPDADTELHTLTSHSHLILYILAIKSLLRFHNDISIFVHDDGSLKNKDIMLLKNHIRGIRIIERKFADKKMIDILRRLPNSKKYRVAQVNSIQLFDYALFSKTGKIISLDSDTLFFRKPNQLIGWISNDKKEIICAYERKPSGQEEFLLRNKCNFPPHINIGLVCFYKHIIDLKKIESILVKMRDFDLYTNQNLFPVLIKNKSKEYKTMFFDINKYQQQFTFKNGAIFRHYWTSGGIRGNFKKDFIKIVTGIIKKKNKNEIE